MFVSMHHQVMDLQDEAVQPYEGGKGTIEEVHQDRTRRKNIIKPKKTSNTKEENDRVKLDHRHHYIIDHRGGVLAKSESQNSLSKPSFLSRLGLGWVNPAHL